MFIRVANYTVNNETFTIYGVMGDEIGIATEIICLLMQFEVPFSLMQTLDIKVSIRLKKSKQSTNNNKSSKFTRNTIIIDFIYLFFNFPPTIYNIHYVFVTLFQFYD